MRLIDADELIDSPIRVEGLIGGKYFVRAIPEEAIKNAPTIDAVPQWIPVSEGLPEDCNEVIVFGNSSEFDWSTICLGSYETEHKKWWICVKAPIDVVAWIPLPKPFKMDGKDGEER